MHYIKASIVNHDGRFFHYTGALKPCRYHGKHSIQLAFDPEDENLSGEGDSSWTINYGRRWPSSRTVRYGSEPGLGFPLLTHPPRVCLYLLLSTFML